MIDHQKVAHNCDVVGKFYVFSSSFTDKSLRLVAMDIYSSPLSQYCEWLGLVFYVHSSSLSLILFDFVTWSLLLVFLAGPLHRGQWEPAALVFSQQPLQDLTVFPTAVRVRLNERSEEAEEEAERALRKLTNRLFHLLLWGLSALYATRWSTVSS